MGWCKIAETLSGCFAASCLAAARSRRGSDMPPACHSLPRRHFVTSRRSLYNLSRSEYRIVKRYIDCPLGKYRFFRRKKYRLYYFVDMRQGARYMLTHSIYCPKGQICALFGNSICFLRKHGLKALPKGESRVLAMTIFLICAIVGAFLCSPARGRGLPRRCAPRNDKLRFLLRF